MPFEGVAVRSTDPPAQKSVDAAAAFVAPVMQSGQSRPRARADVPEQVRKSVTVTV